MRLKAKLPGFLLLIAIFSTFAAAEPISQLHASNYVNDFAGVLDQRTTTQLNDICRQIDQKADAQIAVVIINSLDGSDIESYANTLFRTWGVGTKKTNKGVLILLAVSDHRYRTEVGYGLEPILPDGKVGGFGREAVPFLRQSDYNGAVSLMVTRVATVIAQDAGITLTNTPAIAAPSVEPPPSTSDFDWGTLIFVVLFGGIGLLYVLYKISEGSNWRGGRGGGFWSSGSGGFFDDGSGGGSSWGGFGGGDSGGGFGGFGGGDSGGGGASGSW